LQLWKDCQHSIYTAQQQHQHFFFPLYFLPLSLAEKPKESIPVRFLKLTAVKDSDEVDSSGVYVGEGLV